MSITLIHLDIDPYNEFTGHLWLLSEYKHAWFTIFRENGWIANETSRDKHGEVIAMDSRSCPHTKFVGL